MASTSPVNTAEKPAAAENPVSRKSPTPTMSKHKPQTSASAFASSGFASLATASSPFGSISSSTPSVFGGGASTKPSGFGALAAGSSGSTTTATTSSGFGALAGKPAGGFSFGGSGTSSGFGGLNTGSVFGSKLGNGFAGGSGPKLSSFAATSGTPVIATTSKPVKAFGAPESDEDAGSDDGGSDGGAGGSDDEESAPAAVEEKKKTKITKGKSGALEVKVTS